MKKLLVSTLCAFAVLACGFGNARAATTIELASQEQKGAQNLDVYVGIYEVGKDFFLTITNENGKLMGEPGGEKVEFKPEANPDEFFSRAVNARLKFARDSAGAVIAVMVSIDGKDFYSKKIK